ncbi:hypothetical protein SADUNF_Sadunf18G0030000 [Salix dunnii]|uniref:Uncharacterized protein n=1 Tax=Salix dunnii TaxID=1413687 RepID=A0A835J557_9ROSI|nr:hypothetical protein SADUNF_Sadunf18G0030000 [Salix dunnii]
MCSHTHHENSRRLLFLYCSDIMEIASYAPLLMNCNDRRWTLDAIAFNFVEALWNSELPGAKILLRRNMLLLVDIRYRRVKSSCKSSI